MCAVAAAFFSISLCGLMAQRVIYPPEGHPLHKYYGSKVTRVNPTKDGKYLVRLAVPSGPGEHENVWLDPMTSEELESLNSLLTN